jgi:ubiquitin carboxyl-terminal hydrolase 3
MYQSRSLREMNDALMAEELRKILISLTQGGSKGAISPESLFLVIWKIVPRFR